MTTVHIMLGGPEDHLPADWSHASEDAVWMGVDRGALRLIEKGIKPEIAVGDFDSVSEEEYRNITDSADKVMKVESEKDDTDTELAVEAAFQRMKAEKVVLYGGTGGRIDHLMSVLLLPAQPRFSSYIDRLIVKDTLNTVSYFPPGCHPLQKEADKRYVSIVGVTPVKSLTLTGLKYPLEGKDLHYPAALVSNEFLTEEASLSFQEGILAVIQSKD